MWKYIQFFQLLVLSLSLSCARAAEVVLTNEQTTATINPQSLRIFLANKEGVKAEASAAQEGLGSIENLKTNATGAAWRFKESAVDVNVVLRGGTLEVHLAAAKPGEFCFPVIKDDNARGWILPMFEGVYAPCRDERWRKFLTTRGEMNTTADLTMPFVGLEVPAGSLTCILTNQFNNSLEFHTNSAGGLVASLTHSFTRNHDVKEYGVIFEMGGPSPVEPARLYREWIQARGEFVSLKEKIARTPAAAKLPGAAHVYLWGSGLLCHGDVKDWKGLAKDLIQGAGAEVMTPARRVWSLMEPEARMAATNIVTAEWPDRYTKSRITDELNQLLTRSNLFEQVDWDGVAIADDLRRWVKSNKEKCSKAEVCGNNCKLLAGSFPARFADPAEWGNGVSPKMIRELQAAGLDRLWLGCDGWDGFLNRPEIVALAEKAGYLIGPYDSYHSIHRPGEPETWETAQFGRELFETGAIVRADGTKQAGFKHTGYLLSPKAARPYMEKRVAGLMREFHANSWFMDCDGFGEYFDDYSPGHPATQQTDMLERISRMAWIRDGFGAVIGTEGCSACVASTVHFAHGVLTPVIGWGDPDMTNKKSPYYTGAYYPPDEPKIQFMPIPIKEEYRYIYFEPRFRLPLFETVFHDSVVATHHWSFASFKTRDLAKTVELLELLYNVPPLYHLNIDEFTRRKKQIQHHYAFFSPLHRVTAELPMTDFKWLNQDGSVQQTTFGEEIDMVANFGEGRFIVEGTDIPAGSILARWRKSGKVEVYSP